MVRKMQKWDRQKFLSLWAIFCPFSPPTSLKVKVLKLKKTPGNIIILHICTISDNDNHRCIVPEIYIAKDILFCHSEPFFALLLYGPRKSKFWKNEKNTWRYYSFTNVYHKWQLYNVYWGMECNGKFFVSFWTNLCPFTLLTTQKIKILKKR